MLIKIFQVKLNKNLILFQKISLFYPETQKLDTTSGFNEVAKGDLGEERILLGKIAEGGRSEPLNSC